MHVPVRTYTNQVPRCLESELSLGLRLHVEFCVDRPILVPNALKRISKVKFASILYILTHEYNFSDGLVFTRIAPRRLSTGKQS